MGDEGLRRLSAVSLDQKTYQEARQRSEQHHQGDERQEHEERDGARVHDAVIAHVAANHTVYNAIDFPAQTR